MKRIITIIAALAIGALSAFSQTLTSKGKVTNIDGSPLAGVNVTFKAKSGNIETTTDEKGLFTMSGLPDKGAMLNFNKDGYKNYRQKVSTSNQIYITLAVDDNGVDTQREVGYGSSSKSSSTSSTSGVSASDMKGEINGSNSMKTILGRLSGLGPDMKVRGASNYPLFVINGVISSKDAAENLNANDIDRVELLKDASSTAVYGSRGGDGVILIRTKGYGSKSKTEKPAKTTTKNKK